MKASEGQYLELSNVKNPSALFSLQLCNRNKQSLAGLEKFKNLTELDVSGNCLNAAVPELFSLKYLRKINISRNEITDVWPVPEQCENLCLSNNKIASLSHSFLSMQRLQTLDLSFNQIASLPFCEELAGLKSLYLNNNRLTTLAGLKALRQLIELDLGQNCLSSKESISELDLNSSIVAVNIKDNPVLKLLTTARAGFVFNSAEDFPGSFTEVSQGLYFRNPERLKKLKSSRYKGIIKTYKDQEKDSNQMASPDWGCKTSQMSRAIIIEDAIDTDFLTPDSAVPKSGMNLLLEEDLNSKKTISIAKLDLDKLSNKLSNEKSSTKPESSLEALFEELITHFNIEGTHEKDFSFSTEKYEHAVNFLKNREDERKGLIDEHRQLKLEIKKLKHESRAFAEEKKEMEERFNGEIRRLEEWIQRILEQSREKKTEVQVQTEYLPEFEELSVLDASLKSGLRSYSQLPDLSMLSESSKHIGGYEYLVDKNIGEYIEKLLHRISELIRKKKQLRDANKKLERIIRTKQHCACECKFSEQ